jgi:hypothetical protein
MIDSDDEHKGNKKTRWIEMIDEKDILYSTD